jgi:hypothetical protein
MRCVAIAAALLLLWLAAGIPIAGTAVVVLLLLFGLGGFWVEAYRRYVRPRTARAPPVDMQAV